MPHKLLDWRIVTLIVICNHHSQDHEPHVMIYRGIIWLAEPQSCFRGSLAVGSEVCRGSSTLKFTRIYHLQCLFLVNKLTTTVHSASEYVREISMPKGFTNAETFASNSTAWPWRSGGWCNVAAMVDGYKRLSYWVSRWRTSPCLRSTWNFLSHDHHWC